MSRKLHLAFSFILVLFTLTPSLASSAIEETVAASPDDSEGVFTPKFGIVVKASSLGAGTDIGVSVANLVNVRAGVNGMNFGAGFTNSGIRYDGTLRFRSAEAIVDVTPLRDWFHVSPGLLIYNGNKLTASAMVPGGQIFDLNNVSFLSSPTDPIHGGGQLAVNKTAPMLMFGFGNPIPHHHHFTIYQDFGVVYQGTPKTTLNLSGTACDPLTGVVCVNAATNSAFQSQLQAEQTKINKDTAIARFYPLFTIGLGFRF